MNAMSKFGMFLFSLSSAFIIALKIMNKYNLGINSGFYDFFVSYGVVFPFMLAIALVMLFGVYIKNFYALVGLFGFFLIIGYVVIAPVYLSGI